MAILLLIIENMFSDAVNGTKLTISSSASFNISEGHKNKTCYAAFRCVIPQEGTKPSRDVKVIIDVLGRWWARVSNFLPWNDLDYQMLY